MPIHSGQFMVMSLSDNEDDKPKPHKKRSLKYWSIRASTKKSIHRSANRNVDGTASLTRTGSDSSIHVDNDKIDFSIEKLTKSLQLFQNNYKPSNENIENLVMSPKWNNFLGTSFNVRRIIRLNNIIWREWFRQNQLKLKPRVCKFVNQLNRKECSFYLGKHQFLQKLMYVPREYRYFRLLYLQKHCIETQKLSYSPIALWNPRSIICRDQDTRQEEINFENGTDNYWDMNNYHHYAFQASPAQQLNKLSSAYAHTRPLYENPNDQNSNPMEMYQHDYLDNYQYTQKNNFYMQDALQHHFSTFPTSNYSSNPNLSEYDVNSNLIHDDLNSFSNLNYNIKSVNTHFNCQFQQKPQLHNYSKYYKINYDCVIDAMNKNKRIKVENEKTEFQNVSIGDTEFKKSFQNYVNFYEKKATSQCDENKFYNQYMAKNKNKSNNLLNTPGRFTQDKPIKKFHSPLQNSESDFSGIGDIKLNISAFQPGGYDIYQRVVRI
ncbi:hypothetical protein A3Q56_07114 [Intoshia linei]|uniref:Uncharacterized protein n=1 Tax=Intoshia linei TaxID=1819745 RepID=A0A177AT50_9BILA|nr:hypothetical protein A3Q56_07114 [Intoshia linei]